VTFAMIEVEISNSQDLLQLDETRLREVAEQTLLDEQVAAAEISVALVDDATLRELNRRHLGHDYDTDVLSFLLECTPGESGSAQPPTRRGSGKRIEGEVIISAEMAQHMAADFGWSAEDEVVLYLVHGLLHLVGYDDLTDEERPVMRRREREVLKLFDLTPRYAD
jgi:probable rRNA maturation factor